jgi:hypothetical protein
LAASVLQASAQSTSTIVKNGDISGEHATFRFNGKVLTIRSGSDRSGLGFTTDWYIYKNGSWRAYRAHQASDLREVNLQKCDQDESLDISDKFPQFVPLLPSGSKLKYVITAGDQDANLLVISSQPASNTQTGSILQISLIRNGQGARRLASSDIGESQFCRAQWNEHKDGSKDLIVFTIEPAGSSVSYAFQSFAIRK